MAELYNTGITSTMRRFYQSGLMGVRAVIMGLDAVVVYISTVIMGLGQVDMSRRPLHRKKGGGDTEDGNYFESITIHII